VTHQVLAYTGDVNVLGDKVGTIKKTTRTSGDASKDVGLEVNVEKANYILYCCLLD
jgi:hypothetical protein